MNCPKCNAPLEPVTTQAGTVERCIACQGLWFDRLEAPAQAAFAAGEFRDLSERSLSGLVRKLTARDRGA